MLAGRGSALGSLTSAALAPFLPLIPLFTLAVYAHERRFGARQFRAFQEAFGLVRPAPRPVHVTASLEEAA